MGTRLSAPADADGLRQFAEANPIATVLIAIFAPLAVLRYRAVSS